MAVVKERSLGGGDQEQSEANGMGGSMYASLLTPLFDSGGGVLDLLQGLSTRR